MRRNIVTVSMIIIVGIVMVFISCEPGQSQVRDCVSVRLSRLESKIQKLEKRIAVLETPRSEIATRGKASKANLGGWRVRGNWRKLKKGMSENEVIKLLGNPEKIQTVADEYWWYWDFPAARVELSGNKTVVGWSEP